jgi:hypothetical protein
MRDPFRIRFWRRAVERKAPASSMPSDPIRAGDSAAHPFGGDPTLPARALAGQLQLNQL